MGPSTLCNAHSRSLTQYTVSVPENKVGALVVKLPVTDGDEPHTPAWSTTYKIIKGNNGGFFNVSTGPSKLEGIITTVKVRARILVTEHVTRSLKSIVVVVFEIACFRTNLTVTNSKGFIHCVSHLQSGSRF